MSRATMALPPGFERIKDSFIKLRIAFIFCSNYISFVKFPTTLLLPFIQSTFKKYHPRRVEFINDGKVLKFLLS